MHLEQFFNPRSVAVVGASRKTGKVGFEVFSALLKADYKGKIFAVNPNADEIMGVKTHPDLTSIGETPDLVVIIVHAKFIADTMKECAKIGVKSVIIITSGFNETGPEGAKLEKAVIRIAKSAGIRVIGPNCIGMMLPEINLNVSFAGKLPPLGNVAYFSQSGSLMAAMVDMAESINMGFSKLISIGNKADINELDVMKAFHEDPATKVIAGYLETIGNGDAFIKLAEQISLDKPILLIKSGVTAAGAKAALSHTGRLAGSETAYECVFERAGVIRCDSIKTQFNLARAFAYQPPPKGPNVAVIANAGGAGIMAADAIDRVKLTLAKLSDETIRKLTTELENYAGINNPIDLLGDAPADRYEKALNIVIDDSNVDSVLIALSPHAMTECAKTAEAVVRVSKAGKQKPILACFLGAGRVEEALKILQEGRVPHYGSPESAVATVKAMAHYAKWKSRPKRVVKLFPVNRRKAETVIQRSLKQKSYEIGEIPTKEILQAYGFVTPKGGIATSAEQAVNIANQIGYPVVLKIWSPDIIHKNKVGGVKTNLVGEQAVRDAFDLMMYRIPQTVKDADIMGILVEEMYSRGKEVILGMNRDKRFGPLLMVGMGGRLVEVLKDVVFYPAPITSEEAKEMLFSTQTYQLLASQNSKEPIEIDAIAEGLQRLSQLVTEIPQIKEIDINPFVVGSDSGKPVAVDAMMKIEDI